MDADLVLEGGGVKGIGLIGAVSVLEEAGYRFRRVGGTSAGAMVAALLAAGYTAAELHALMREVSLADFRDPGFLGRLGPPGMGLAVWRKKGIYRGEALRRWLEERLAARAAGTFGDLRETGDPESDLRPALAYRLVVTAADLSHGRLVHLPWDYKTYGLDLDTQPVAGAVRASVSIPFFYKPVRLDGPALDKPVVLVDGGLLSNFPIGIFDRQDARPPRWPTFGIKLSARPDATQVPNRIEGTADYVRAVVSTLLTAHEQMHLDDPCVVRRTIFVDTGTIRATDFDLDDEAQRMLYENGRRAARRFLDRWDFDDYVRACRTPE